MVGKVSIKTCSESKRAVMLLCNNKCAFCGIVVAETIDHLDPKDNGGRNFGNRLPACQTCNGLKSNMSLEDFRFAVAHDWGKWKRKTHWRLAQRYSTFSGRFYFEELGVNAI